MLGKMLSEETLKGRWIHAVSSGPSLGEGWLFSASQLKLKRDRSCLWCFSVTFISSVRRCFLPTRRSCLKNPTQVNPAVCNNQYIHLHFPHFYAYTSLSVSPPFKSRNYREGHKEKRLVYGRRSLVCCSPGSHRVGHDWIDLAAAAAA